MKLPRVSRKTWIALGLLAALVVVLFLTMGRREGMENPPSPGILYGVAIRSNDPAGVAIQETRKLPDGRTVYIAQDGADVKMVAEDGENGYFTGTISQFDPSAWPSYRAPGDGYKLKLNTPTVPAPAAPAPAAETPSPSTPPSSAMYSASCSKCTVLNNQITCACDVLPK